MHVKIGLGVAAVTALTVAAVAPAASARQAVDSAAPAITQTYTCSTPIGEVALSGEVTGKAKIKGGKIFLSKVVYSITNSVGLDLTVDNVKISTPDPSKASAPYKKNSVAVAKTPKGWKAGHDSSGVFASYKKSMVILAGDDVTSAALSAQYTVKGAPGTKVQFQAGPVSFHVSAPVEGTVSCLPDAPAGTFASVTE